MSSLNEESKNNQFKENNKEKSNLNHENLILLPYYFKSNSTSEDPSFPLLNLEERNTSNGGWVSEKNCKYPQKIIAKFNKLVDVKQINIIINETKIPTAIQFINCIELEENASNNKNKYRYENIGYIELSSNIESNYKSREFRKILLNIYNTNRIKILIHENYKNSFNKYNQVGIVSLEFYGNIISNNNNKIIEKRKFNEGQNNKMLKIRKEDYKKLRLFKINDRPKNKYINNNINIINHLNQKNDDLDKNDYINKINNNEKFVLNRSKSTYSKTNKVIKKINNKFLGTHRDKANEEIIVDNGMEEIKAIIEKNKKEKKIQENNEFKKLHEQINELKSILTNIYQEKKSLSPKNYNIKENVDFSPKNYIKLKTMNNKILFNGNQKKIVPSNYLRYNNSFNYQTINRKTNQSKDNLLTKRLNIKQKSLPYLSSLSYDSFPLISIRKKDNRDNKENSESNDENNNIDSLNESIGDEKIEDKNNEEIPLEIKEKNESLILLIGEDIIKNIFSKNIYKQEEGFDSLIQKINEIIIYEPENLIETNNYIILLINIIMMFIDDKRPIIVMKCLELFINILKAIEEKSNLNKIEYNFKISNHIIIKIKEKLSHSSKRIRQKAEELYSCMIDSEICDLNLLISELLKEETNEYNYKMNLLNNGNYNLNSNNDNEMNTTNNLNIFSYKCLTIIKMNILLKVFDNYEKKTRKFNIKKFPQKIVGDYIVININKTKEEIRKITKNVLVKYIHIFGNGIFYKLKLVIGNYELSRIIQDNEELKQEMKNYENDRNKKIKDAKILLNNIKYNNKSLVLSPLVDNGKIIDYHLNKFRNMQKIKPKLPIINKSKSPLYNNSSEEYNFSSNKNVLNNN